jgi:hypothetical protein
MKTSKVKGLEIVPPKSESGLYQTDTFMPKMHQVCVAVGKRASGKSTAIVNLIERLKYDYCIAVSPTMNSNKELMDRLKIEHTFEDVDDPSIIDKIKNIVNAEAEDLERYKDELKRYNKLMKDLKEGKYLDDDLLLQFFNDENYFQKPEHRWGGLKPRIAVIFDDLLGSGIYSRPRKLNGLSTYSRHVGSLKEGGAIGVSLFFLIQSFKCQTGGLNKVIRNQCTSMCLFKTKDKQEMKDVAESVSGEIDEELFNKVYDTAIKEPYDFLFIDLHKKKEHLSMFRRRFDEFIIPDELKKN